MSFRCRRAPRLSLTTTHTENNKSVWVCPKITFNLVDNTRNTQTAHTQSSSLSDHSGGGGGGIGEREGIEVGEGGEGGDAGISSCSYIIMDNDKIIGEIT